MSEAYTVDPAAVLVEQWWIEAGQAFVAEEPFFNHVSPEVRELFTHSLSQVLTAVDVALFMDSPGATHGYIMSCEFNDGVLKSCVVTGTKTAEGIESEIAFMNPEEVSEYLTDD